MTEIVKKIVDDLRKNQNEIDIKAAEIIEYQSNEIEKLWQTMRAMQDILLAIGAIKKDDGDK